MLRPYAVQLSISNLGPKCSALTAIDGVGWPSARESNQCRPSYHNSIAELVITPGFMGSTTSDPRIWGLRGSEGLEIHLLLDGYRRDLVSVRPRYGPWHTRSSSTTVSFRKIFAMCYRPRFDHFPLSFTRCGSYPIPRSVIAAYPEKLGHAAREYLDIRSCLLGYGS